ncbi:uncharacterized protein V1518DRAFT_406429 [Limtongia smithiae]|uniref:uncharacterized protein n=1 Tax=Limtongia smithiae TaxID=1125753 RepID=UPI0034CF9DA6
MSTTPLDRRADCKSAEYDPEYVPTAVVLFKLEYPVLNKKEITSIVRNSRYSLRESYIRVLALKDILDRFNICDHAGNEDSNEDFNSISFEKIAGLMQELDQVQETIRLEERAYEEELSDIRKAELFKFQEAIDLAKLSSEPEPPSCGCCFTEFKDDNDILICSEGHIFCHECIVRFVENVLGESKYNMSCITVGGCPGKFKREEIEPLIPQKSLQLLDKMQQRSEIIERGAKIVICPFCDFFTSDDDFDAMEGMNFKCLNAGCKIVSCPYCNEVAHLPRSCASVRQEKEAKHEDTKLDAKHKIEEAMTQALVRTCAKCKQRFVKTGGCNKMTCPRCRNTQCYVCGKAAIDYTHFGSGTETGRNPCPLEDDLAARHTNEVAEAARKATASLLKENKALSTDDIIVAVPNQNENLNNGYKQNGELSFGPIRHGRVLGARAMDHPYVLPPLPPQPKAPGRRRANQ